MRLRRRFAEWTFNDVSFDESSTLKVEHYRDSDDDLHYTLVILGDGRRRVLAKALNDPYELMALAEWLGARTEFAIDRSGTP